MWHEAESSFIFSHMGMLLSQHHSWTVLSSPNGHSTLVSCACVEHLFLSSLSWSSGLMSILGPLSLDHYCIIVSFKIRKCES